MNTELQHFRKTSAREFEFHAAALEITILDRRGHIIWQQHRSHGTDPIRWPGLDLYGTRVDVGNYTCKILYSNQSEAVYLPFVFMHD